MKFKTKWRYFLMTMVVWLTLPVKTIGAIELIDTELIEPFKSALTVEELVEALPEDASLDDPAIDVDQPRKPFGSRFRNGICLDRNGARLQCEYFRRV